jgi:hypothetical protein
MAKQTINIGTAPNDGTGTPLRTAFDYCNLNFTELYTATGPSGNNIVVPGTATITGDLTAQNNIYVPGNVSKKIGPVGSTWGGLRFDSTNQPFLDSDIGITFRTGGSTSFTTSYVIGATGISTWYVGGSTAMTLNSTGLGVGVSPSNNLHVQGASGSTAIRISAVTDGTLGFIGSASGLVSGSPSNNLALRAENGLYLSGGGNATQFVLNTSGNVGVGVTPSAWGRGKGLEVGSIGNAFWGDSSSNGILSISANAYLTTSDLITGWKYATTNPAGRYQISETTHSWYTAASGTAGSAITFTQAMTLDASGNLLVGKTASSSTVVGAELRPSGAIISTLAASTNADFALYTYSTGAGAARFYVGMSGTVFATNTTISAISDQRLKENVQDIDVGLGAILALKPRKFDWKEGKGKNIKGDRGFIAQEFETVFPQLVDEWADPAPEGEAPYKSVRQDLIPVLVKAIQELTARVQTLEAK